MTKRLKLFFHITVGCVVFNACSSAELKKRQEENNALRSQLGESKATITALQFRLDSLEAKVTAITEKAKEPEQFDHTIQTTRVTAHPSEGTGSTLTAVEPEETLSSSNIRSSIADPGTSDGGFVNDEAISQYRKGVILLNAGRFPEAMLAFSSFVENFPDHPLAGSAQYFVGDSYFRQKEYKLALQEFNRVLTAYDRSSHVALALRKMIDVEEILKLEKEASKHKQLLSSLFPLSPEITHSENIGLNVTVKPDITSLKNQAEENKMKQTTELFPSGLDTPPTAPLGTSDKQLNQTGKK